MRRDRIVYLRWLDSCGPTGSVWIDASQALPEVCVCESVGWIVSETDEAIMVAGHVEHDISESASGVLSIPKVAIVERRNITLPKKRGRRK